MKQFFVTHLDRFGIITSLLCAVHCSVLPVILALGLFSGISWMDSHMMEFVFIGLSVVFIITSLGHSFIYKHRNALPLKVAIVGLGCIALALFSPHMMHVFTSTVGGLCIAVSHYLNIRLLKSL